MDYSTALALVIGGGSILITGGVFLVRWISRVHHHRTHHKHEPRLL